MVRKLLAAAAALFTVIATIASASACWFYLYQPEEPKSLRQ